MFWVNCISRQMLLLVTYTVAFNSVFNLLAFIINCICLNFEVWTGLASDIDRATVLICFESYVIIL